MRITYVFQRGRKCICACKLNIVNQISDYEYYNETI